jgi:hypothetical protein
VYSKHSALRLNGNRKPFGPVLTQYVPECFASIATVYSEEELLWRGLPNYALPSDIGNGYTLLQHKDYAEDEGTVMKSTTKQIKNQQGNATNAVHRNSVDRILVSTTLQAHLYKLLQPDFEVLNEVHKQPLEFRKVSMQQTRQGYRIRVNFENNTAKCFSKSACLGGDYVHQSNACYAVLQNESLTTRCFDAHCMHHTVQLPVRWSSEEFQSMCIEEEQSAAKRRTRPASEDDDAEYDRQSKKQKSDVAKPVTQSIDSYYAHTAATPKTRRHGQDESDASGMEQEVSQSKSVTATRSIDSYYPRGSSDQTSPMK